MSDTIMISIDESSWTQVAASGNGFITNESTNSLYYAESSVQPDDEDEGHTLKSNDFVSYTMTGGQSVWTRMKRGSGRVSVTPE